MKRVHARLGTELVRGGRPHTRICGLRSDWPLMLRPTLPLDDGTIARWSSRDAVPAQVHQAAAAAGPIGGDRQHLRIDVGAGSALVLGEVSPTLLLPGPRGEQSHTEVDIAVGPGATLAWLPQLVIAARGCLHRADVRIALEPGSRLLLREQSLFGRCGERSGALRQRVRVRLGGRPLFDQELAVGPGLSDGCGPAITGGQRSVGSLLLVDADAQHSAGGDQNFAIMPLRGPGVAATALAPDTATLTRKLAAALTRILGRS